MPIFRTVGREDVGQRWSDDWMNVAASAPRTRNKIRQIRIIFETKGIEKTVEAEREEEALYGGNEFR